MLTYLLTVTGLIRGRMYQVAAEDERGAFSAEYVIWVAALAVAAIAVVAIVVTKLTDKANSINLG